MWKGRVPRGPGIPKIFGIHPQDITHSVAAVEHRETAPTILKWVLLSLTLTDLSKSFYTNRMLTSVAPFAIFLQRLMMTMMMMMPGSSLRAVERDQLPAVLRRDAIRDGAGWVGHRDSSSRRRLPRLGASSDHHPVLAADDRRQCRLRPTDGARARQRCRGVDWPTAGREADRGTYDFRSHSVPRNQPVRNFVLKIQHNQYLHCALAAV